jgi:hypothetical protein
LALFFARIVSNATHIVAETGYQVIPTLHPKYDAIDPHWWNIFGVRNEPGSLCNDQTFLIGSTLITTYSLFPWTVVSPNTNDLSSSSIPYRGTNLDSCDVYSMSVDANVLAGTVKVDAIVSCTSPDFPLLVQTSWTGWGANNAYNAKKTKLDANAETSYPTEGRAGGINSVNEM